MAHYLIAYDLQKPDKNYDRVHDRIKELDPNWRLGRVLESTWLIETEKSPGEIVSQLAMGDKEKNDRILVVGIRGPWDSVEPRADDYLREWLGPPSKL